jgi:hypothetical protein
MTPSALVFANTADYTYNGTISGAGIVSIERNERLQNLFGWGGIGAGYTVAMGPIGCRCSRGRSRRREMLTARRQFPPRKSDAPSDKIRLRTPTEVAMAALIPPTYEDATLVLRLYELRREDRLRAAREWYRAKFFPQSYDDVKAIALAAGAENESWRMVTSYWDMAASFVAQGVLHPELFFDSGGEAPCSYGRR